MLRIIFLILFLFLGSCGGVKKQMINLPHSAHSWQITDSGEAPVAKRVSQAIIIFYRQWQLKFGDHDEKIKKNLDELMVEWCSEEKAYDQTERDDRGRIIITRHIVKGMTLCPTYVWLRTNPYKRVFASSLVHELVHISLWSQECDSGDPDHEGGENSCWTDEHTKFIKHVNKVLLNLDI